VARELHGWLEYTTPSVGVVRAVFGMCRPTSWPVSAHLRQTIAKGWAWRSAAECVEARREGLGLASLPEFALRRVCVCLDATALSAVMSTCRFLYDHGWRWTALAVQRVRRRRDTLVWGNYDGGYMPIEYDSG
jgi:hypothetical protein